MRTGICRTATPGSQWAFDRLSASFGRSTRTAEPEEIADLISWPSGNEARNINGAVITTDSGWTA